MDKVMALTIPQMKEYLTKHDISFRGYTKKDEFASLIFSYKKDKKKFEQDRIRRESKLEESKIPLVFPDKEEQLTQALNFVKIVGQEVRTRIVLPADAKLEYVKHMIQILEDDRQNFFIKIFVPHNRDFLHLFVNRDADDYIMLMGIEEGKSVDDPLIYFEANAENFNVKITNKTKTILVSLDKKLRLDEALQIIDKKFGNSTVGTGKLYLNDKELNAENAEYICYVLFEDANLVYVSQ